MDRIEFDGAQATYQSGLQSLRKQIEKDLKKENYKGFRFGDKNPTINWQIAKYPSSYGAKEKARKQQTAIRESRNQQLEEEVERRLKADSRRKAFELEIFGEEGRDKTLAELQKQEAIERKAEALKERQAQERKRNDPAYQTQVVGDKDKAALYAKTQKDSRAKEQNNRRKVRADFNRPYKQKKLQENVNNVVELQKKRRALHQEGNEEKLKTVFKDVRKDKQIGHKIEPDEAEQLIKSQQLHRAADQDNGNIIKYEFDKSNTGGAEQQKNEHSSSNSQKQRDKTDRAGLKDSFKRKQRASLKEQFIQKGGYGEGYG